MAGFGSLLQRCGVQAIANSRDLQRLYYEHRPVEVRPFNLLFSYCSGPEVDFSYVVAAQHMPYRQSRVMAQLSRYEGSAVEV